MIVWVEFRNNKQSGVYSILPFSDMHCDSVTVKNDITSHLLTLNSNSAWWGNSKDNISNFLFHGNWV